MKRRPSLHHDIGALFSYLRRRNRKLMLGWLAAIMGGGLLDLVLKSVFHRPRPLFADPFAHGYGWRFPSGHSMGSVIGFGMLAYVIEKGLHTETAKLTVVALAAMLCLAIGVSRRAGEQAYPAASLARRRDIISRARAKGSDATRIPPRLQWRNRRLDEPKHRDVHEHDELRYWSEKFGVTKEALKAAVQKVGVMANDVEAELKRTRK